MSFVRCLDGLGRLVSGLTYRNMQSRSHRPDDQQQGSLPQRGLPKRGPQYTKTSSCTSNVCKVTVFAGHCFTYLWGPSMVPCAESACKSHRAQRRRARNMDANCGEERPHPGASRVWLQICKDFLRKLLEILLALVMKGTQ